MRTWIILLVTVPMLCACGEGSPSNNFDGGGDDVCPPLEAPEHGFVSQPNRAAGESATYACDEGYALSGNGGSESRTCLEDLTWSGSPPTCVEHDEAIALCPPLEAPEHGAVDHPSRVPGASATYACDEGYMLAGEVTRHCTESLVWSGVPAECVVAHSCASPGESVLARVISGLRLPGEDEIIGFDLDGHHTMHDSDPIGCGLVDQAGGVDNVIGQFFGMLTLLDPEIDFNQRVAAAISAGAITLGVEIRGYDGPDDEFVVVSLFSDGVPIQGAQDLCVASSSTGSVRVAFPTLTLAIPEAYVTGGSTYPLTVDITDVHFEIPNPAAAPTSAVLGGGVLWNGSDGSGLYPEVQAIVDAIVPGLDANAFGAGFLDLGPPGSCDSLSIGLGVVLSPAIQ